MRKLKLSKETLHSLDGEALREAQGGFITVGAFTVCFVGCIIMPKETFDHRCYKTVKKEVVWA